MAQGACAHVVVTQMGGEVGPEPLAFTFRTAGSQRTRSLGESVASTTASTCGARRDAPCTVVHAASSMRAPRTCTLTVPPLATHRRAAAMSTWRHVGMTYLKYADLCATHVTNCLKEPRKSKALSSTAMHVRVTAWEGGKKQKPGVRPPHRMKAGGVPARRALVPLAPRPGSLTHPRRRPTPAPQRLSRRWRRPASRFPQRSVCPRHAGASWVRVFERPSCAARWLGLGVRFMFAHDFGASRSPLQGPDKTYIHRVTRTTDDTHTHTPPHTALVYKGYGG